MLASQVGLILAVAAVELMEPGRHRPVRDDFESLREQKGVASPAPACSC
jgi:hypothetical protein